MERLKSATTKSILWIYLLRMLKDKEMYAYEIKDEIRKRFEFEPALITPYVVLYRLEKSGFVETRWDENKKFYGITEKGEELLSSGIKYFEELIKKLR